jgi:5,10-methylenetetrahydrofolate reductase
MCEQIKDNFNKLKSQFVKYHPFMEIVSAEDMIGLIGKSEQFVIEQMNRWKMTYYGCYEI